MRGTFVFPAADTDFMQLLEIRGNNGAQDDVETVFVLIGETYYVPTQLLALDDPGLYRSATRNGVKLKDRELASLVAEFYTEQDGLKLVAVFHTHPSGNTVPSPADKKWGTAQKRRFDRKFDDYEFFFGIHALQASCDPDPDWLRRPEQTAEHKVTWWGENRKHTLAIFDEHCEPRPLVVR